MRYKIVVQEVKAGSTVQGCTAPAQRGRVHLSLFETLLFSSEAYHGSHTKSSCFSFQIGVVSAKNIGFTTVFLRVC